MSEVDISAQLKVLSEKMDRYEKHREELRKDVKVISDSQRQMIDLLAGTNLNGNKGLVRLLETVEEKVNINKEQVKDIQKDMDNVKFWGRSAMVLLTGFILVLANYFKDLIQHK